MKKLLMNRRATDKTSSCPLLKLHEKSLLRPQKKSIVATGITRVYMQTVRRTNGIIH